MWSPRDSSRNADLRRGGVRARSGGYIQLERWAAGFGRILAVGIEGTGPYGAGVASHTQRQGPRVIEVNRPDRRERRMSGESDASMLRAMPWRFFQAGRSRR